MGTANSIPTNTAIVNEAKLMDGFFQRKPMYDRLSENVRNDLEKILKEEKLNYHQVTTRVKEFPNFFEKVRRKKYTEPFDQTEDFCGVRVIIHFANDIPRANEIIRKHFDVIRFEDNVEDVEIHYFGYRSSHFIVKIKSGWLEHPNFGGLQDLKFEIQLRTLCMHSWSEASHKLDYKNEDFIPKQLRRKLFIASAFLEQADSIFEDLKKESDLLAQREDILTTHSLKNYLARKFPDRNAHDFKILWLYEELVAADCSLQDISAGYDLLQPHLPDIELDLNPAGKRWGQIGAARAILDITADRFFYSKEAIRNRKWYDGVVLWRSKLNPVS